MTHSNRVGLSEPLREQVVHKVIITFLFKAKILHHHQGVKNFRFARSTQH